MPEKEFPKQYDDIAPKPPEGEIDLPSVLPGVGPLEFDIGFGRGHSLFARMEMDSQVRLIGIEIKKKLAFHVEQKRKKLALSSLLVWSGDAAEILKRVNSKECIDRVFVHFPDPWWKKRHHKRILLNPSFLQLLFPLMKKNGELIIQTDVEERAQMYTQSIAEAGGFEITKNGLAEEGNLYGSVSNREVRAWVDGLPFYRIIAQKKEG